MMQDRKALQAGTSHFLGQNFAKAAEIKFLDQSGKERVAWTTSWGVSTRLIGGLIMTHSDDDGLVIPPRVAQTHGVISPIYRNDDERRQVLAYCESLKSELNKIPYCDGKLLFTIDDRDIRGGEKSWQWIKKGVPLRLEIGPRDVAAEAVFVGRRDRAPKDKASMPRTTLVETCVSILEEMQGNLLAKATRHLNENTVKIDSISDFIDYFTPKDQDKPEIHGGFALSHFSPSPEVLERLKELKVTTRCIPLEAEVEPGQCIFSGRPSEKRMVFAKSY
jgi:prolyl-tRNA synthetase